MKEANRIKIDITNLKSQIFGVGYNSNNPEQGIFFAEEYCYPSGYAVKFGCSARYWIEYIDSHKDNHYKGIYKK